MDKVRHYWTAWIPIVYSAVMAAACLAGLVLWDRRGRQTLFCAFALGFAVGLLGFWLHNQGHLVSDVAAVTEAWTRFEHHTNTPPTLAPLAFCGLGVLGMLACVGWFQSTPPAPSADRNKQMDGCARAPAA